MNYSPNFLKYFFNTVHAGMLNVNDANVRSARMGHPKNGDVLVLYVKLNKDKIDTAKFKAYGSAALVAGSEFLCEWLENKTLTELASLSQELILNALDLTEAKNHIAALLCRAAIEGTSSKLTKPDF